MTDLSVDYLDLEDVLIVAQAILGHPPEIRDYGLLEAALARPRASVFGEDAYPDLDTKAAALMISLVNNHALLDGNKRLGWVGVVLFYDLNGYDLKMDDLDAVDFVLAVAEGNDYYDVQKVAEVLRINRTPLRS